MLAQLAQWPLPIPYNRSSSPDSGNFYFDNYLPLPHHVTWRHKSVIIRRSNKNRRQEWNNYSWATFDATFLAYFLATFCRLSEQVKIIPSLSYLSFNLSIYHFVFLFLSLVLIFCLYFFNLSIYHFVFLFLSLVLIFCLYLFQSINSKAPNQFILQNVKLIQDGVIRSLAFAGNFLKFRFPSDIFRFVVGWVTPKCD